MSQSSSQNASQTDSSQVFALKVIEKKLIFLEEK